MSKRTFRAKKREWYGSKSQRVLLAKERLSLSIQEQRKKNFKRVKLQKMRFYPHLLPDQTMVTTLIWLLEIKSCLRMTRIPRKLWKRVRVWAVQLLLQRDRLAQDCRSWHQKIKVVRILIKMRRVVEVLLYLVGLRKHSLKLQSRKQKSRWS